MNDFLFLVPLSIGMGLFGLLAFLWAIRSDQYDDLDGAAQRIIDDDDRPITPTEQTYAAQQPGVRLDNKKPYEETSARHAEPLLPETKLP